MDICLYDNCCGCRVCEYVCPRNAISMKTDGEGFLRPCIETSLCVECGLCQKNCPVNKKDSRMPLFVCAAYSKDDKIRERSSSGGLFAVFAKEILAKKGVVFGAAFDENFHLHHKSVDNTEDLWSLMGSKYVQSDMGDVYKQIGERLNEGIKVLFCGTPCQCTAVKNVFGDNDNLILMDFICHGVPTPILLKKYLNDGFKDVVSVSFRDKKRGWEEFSMRVETKDRVYSSTKNNDPYMGMFLKNYPLRPSCYKCEWKSENVASDITIGDFWGISKIDPSMNDDKGVSMMIIRSEKGRALFEKISDSLKYRETAIEDTPRLNGMYGKSASCPEQRKDFFKMLSSDVEFSEIKKLYGKPLPLKRRIVIRIKVTVKKLLFKIMNKAKQ